MVLFPLSSQLRHSGLTKPLGKTDPIPAWEAVERQQKREAQAWWLVTQADHAALAGDLAANISSPLFPKLDPDVVRAIALHDAGWAQFDGDGYADIMKRKPRSFLEMAPVEFLSAWRDSISIAEQASPLGGIVVSGHFSRLAETRLQSASDAPDDIQRIRSFISSETERQERLATLAECSGENVEVLIDVLQFCDLLSLYLCCGGQENVKFPQKFCDRAIQLFRDSQFLRTSPRVFGSGVSLGIQARRHPVSSDDLSVTTLPFILA
jgi:hypothetical protein